MKKFTIGILLILLVQLQLLAQSPQAFPFKGIGLDNLRQPVANKQISLRITIMSGATNGVIEYIETHRTMTDGTGVFLIDIGQGNLEKGSFSAINWVGNSHFLKIELDDNGGTNYHDLGTTQLLSVPYALHANTVSNEYHKVLKTINDLRNFSDKTATHVHVEAYSVPLDGGGGEFILDASDNSSDDNGGTIIVDRNENRWKREYSGAINVRWFGAMPGGSNSSIGVNAALAVAQQEPANNDYSKGNPGKTIFFPTGRYYFYSPLDTIYYGVVLKGEGSTGSNSKVGTTLFVNYANADDLHGFINYVDNGANNTGGGIRDLTIYALNQSFNANLITLFAHGVDYISHWTAENVRLACKKNAKRALFARDFNADEKWQVRDINLINCYMSGATQDKSTVVISNVANFYMLGGFIYQAGAPAEPGIWITGEDQSTNIVITGATIKNIKLVNARDVYLNCMYINIETGTNVDNIKLALSFDVPPNSTITN